MTEWGERYRAAQKAFEYARRAQIQALQLRCDHLFDDLARCTADELPFHVHRFDESDVPAALADEERWRR